MLNRSNKIISISIIFVIILLSLFQFIPYGKDHNNPTIVSEPNWNSQQTRVLAKRACFDCHSNETIWPWYSNVAPISWLIYRDVADGRRRLDFSDWKNIRLREPGEIPSAITEGEMPSLQYLLIHRIARLSATEKTLLINGLLKTLSQ